MAFVVPSSGRTISQAGGAAGTKNVNDLFAGLLECKWRGIGFPIASLRTTIEHDHAQHAKPDRDGALVEATGRRPYRFSGKAIFRNGIVPGKNESWGILYPTTHLQFLAACADRSTGDFQHPALGTIKAKVVRCESALSGERRDGEDVDVEWIESSDNATDTANLFTSPSPLANVSIQALNLDAELVTLTPPIQEDAIAKGSFLDAITAVTSAIDQASLVDKQLGGSLDHVTYRLNKLSDAIAARRNPQDNAARTAVIRLQSAVHDLKGNILAAPKQIAVELTKAEQTAAAVASHLHMSVTDLIRLNPDLASRPTIPPRTVVRHYK